MTIFIPNPPNAPTKIASALGKQKIHILILTAARTVRFALTRDVLDNPPPLGTSSGFSISDTTGPVEIEWSGDLWALGAAANAGTTYVEFSTQ